MKANPAKEGPKSSNTKTSWIINILVVAAIIAILAGLSIPAIGPGLGAREGVRSRTLLSSLQTACENYVTEYNVLPASPENYILTEILLGQNPKEGSPDRNSRAISFLTIPPKNLNPNKEIIDEWGTPYRITFNPKNYSITVLSAGKDRLFDTKDDITTDR